MAFQMGATTRNKRRIREVDALNARQTLLPQILANKERKDNLAREDDLNAQRVDQWNSEQKLANRQLSFQRKADKKSLAQQERAGQIGMGLEAGKMGVTMANRYGGQGSLGNIFSNNPAMTNAAGGTSVLGGMNLGSGVAGGLAGFGASQMLGKGTSKTKKALLGSAAGALIGGLSGGWGGAVSGGFGGGFGGLF
jgi:hypothetical protein